VAEGDANAGAPGGDERERVTFRYGWQRDWARERDVPLTVDSEEEREVLDVPLRLEL
jgi:hypothetical protein